MNDVPAFNPPCGPVTGWRDGDVLRATGIPYATADRFQPPASAPDRTEVRAATSPVPGLPAGSGTVPGRHPGHPLRRASRQRGLPAPLDHHPGRPCRRRADPCHGLAPRRVLHLRFRDLAIFDPKALVAENRVIVVSVTYRLGLFGYLATGTGRPANLGLLDQLEAFRWVQRNISAFGGDPERVTAFGQSAGGDAVAHLMATPEAPVAVPARHHPERAPGHYPGPGENERRHGRRSGNMSPKTPRRWTSLPLKGMFHRWPGSSG